MKNLTKKLLLSAFAVSLILPARAQDDKSKLDELMNEGEELVNLEEPAVEDEKKAAPAKPAPKAESAAAENSVEAFLGVDQVESGLVDLATPKEKITEDSATEFLGLEEKVLPELRGFQRFTPPNLHQVAPQLNVPETAVLQDKEPYKGQKYSLIPWSSLDPDAWLSYENWLLERAEKDKDPTWIQRLRDVTNAELMGKVLQCKGTCKLFRGSSSSSVQYLSRVFEGDEIQTSDDSEAWVYLLDGTLARIGPKSSVSFQEMNISTNEIFQLVRLNHGHLFWNPRDPNAHPDNSDPETDAMALPLQLREANQEAFERLAFKAQGDRSHLDETYELDVRGAQAQIARLNQLRQQNFGRTPDITRVMLVTPTVTLIAKRAAFDVLYLMGSDSYFKRRNALEGAMVHAQKRGYKDADLYDILDDKWWKSTELGRRIEFVETPPGELQVTELVTKRIRTLELARELWFEKFSLPIFDARYDAGILPKRHGYLLWGDQLQRRFDFLLEYTRRMETTNLRSIENLVVKMEARGDKFPRTPLTDDFYRAAVGRYLLRLKTRNMSHRTQVREMSDLQYYTWILRQGKL